jgi:hypothetical protein
MVAVAAPAVIVTKVAECVVAPKVGVYIAVPAPVTLTGAADQLRVSSALTKLPGKSGTALEYAPITNESPVFVTAEVFPKAALCSLPP